MNNNRRNKSRNASPQRAQRTQRKKKRVSCPLRRPKKALPGGGTDVIYLYDGLEGGPEECEVDNESGKRTRRGRQLNGASVPGYLIFRLHSVMEVM